MRARMRSGQRCPSLAAWQCTAAGAGWRGRVHSHDSAALLAQVKPCLVINKLDRLVLELRMDPLEAYQRCQQVS
jgi:hypothetical protein